MTTSREAFEKWWLEPWSTPDETRKDLAYYAWQAGREALLAEIKAGTFVTVFDYEDDLVGHAHYRLPEGGQHE